MAIGLTREELKAVFLDCFDNRMQQSDVEFMTADMGLNPLTKTESERVQKLYGFNDIKTAREFSIIFAILDTIAINNEAIGKSINL